MPKKRTTLLTAIQKAFARSGRSIKSVADEAGLPYASVHGLFRDDRNVSLATAQAICDVLSLELKPAKNRRTVGRG